MSTQTHDENVKKLAEMIEGIDFAMMTTVDDDGTLRSRPMSTQQAEFDGDLWFFTRKSSAKVDEMQHDQQVNVSYSDPDSNRYISVSGTASVVNDQSKKEELWNPAHKAWFPDGLEDPDLVLIKVNAEKAEYWDSPSNVIVQLAGFAKAILTGEEYDGGENKKLDL